MPVWGWLLIPGNTITVPSPPRIIPGRMRFRNVKQKINFEAIIGGEENPRFTAAIQLDVEPEKAIDPLFGKKDIDPLFGAPGSRPGTGYGKPASGGFMPTGLGPITTGEETSIEEAPLPEAKTLTELGEKTATVNNSLEKAMLSFENQQENLDALSLKIATFLSKHQFVN